MFILRKIKDFKEEIKRKINIFMSLSEKNLLAKTGFTDLSTCTHKKMKVYK